MGTHDLDTKRPITITIVDDHQVVLDGIRSWVADDPLQQVEILASGYSIEEVLAGPGELARVLVLDLGIFGESVVHRVSELAESRKVVAFSATTADETIREVLDAGASAYITKNEGALHFIHTVVATAHDQPYVTPSLAGAILGDERPYRPKLSPQELRALRLWFQLPKKQAVASQMGISVETVDQYISRARLKYAASGRAASTKAAMVARAIEDGLIRPGDVQ